MTPDEHPGGSEGTEAGISIEGGLIVAFHSYLKQKLNYSITCATKRLQLMRICKFNINRQDSQDDNSKGVRTI